MIIFIIWYFGATNVWLAGNIPVFFRTVNFVWTFAHVRVSALTFIQSFLFALHLSHTCKRTHKKLVFIVFWGCISTCFHGHLCTNGYHVWVRDRYLLHSTISLALCTASKKPFQNACESGTFVCSISMHSSELSCLLLRVHSFNAWLWSSLLF